MTFFVKSCFLNIFALDDICYSLHTERYSSQSFYMIVFLFIIYIVCLFILLNFFTPDKRIYKAVYFRGG